MIPSGSSGNGSSTSAGSSFLSSVGASLASSFLSLVVVFFSSASAPAAAAAGVGWDGAGVVGAAAAGVVGAAVEAAGESAVTGCSRAEVKQVRHRGTSRRWSLGREKARGARCKIVADRCGVRSARCDACQKVRGRPSGVRCACLHARVCAGVLVCTSAQVVHITSVECGRAG